MIEVKDRIPTYPGRVKMTPVAGQDNTYDMVRADEPIEPGTPINKALFDGIDTAMVALQKNVNDALFAITQRTALANVTVGTEIGLYENGVLTPFIVLNKAYEGTGRVLVVRKNSYKMDSFMNVGDDFYENCKTDVWLNNEYITYLDGATRSVLEPIWVEVGIDTRLFSVSRIAFLLSVYEYGMEPIVGRYEGDHLTYFDNNERRKATFNGSPTIHYTRTISAYNNDNDCAVITATGVAAVEADPVNTAGGIRPAFTLPSNFEVTVGVPSTANTVATAEVI